MSVYADRLQKLYRILEDAQLDAAAFIPSPNLFYLTGATHVLMERPLVLIVPLKGKPAIVVPKLEQKLFASHGFEAEPFAWDDAQGYEGAFADALRHLQLDGKRLGVEGIKMRFFESEALRRNAPAMQIIEADKTLSRLRLHKDATEIANLKKAIQISEAALEKTLTEVRVGMSEQQVAHMLEGHMAALGGEKLSFGTHVLAGGMTANPHGIVRSDYPIKAGEPLLFDFGTTYKGYCADITRTFFVGSVNDHQRAVYEAVQAANQTGRDAIAPGKVIGEVDAETRQKLVDAGFEHLVVHRTGHGLGIDPHEEPSIIHTNQDVLEPGMVFTIEPGLYDAGVVGVRIEDNVTVTESGGESLTTFSRDLRVLEG